MPYPNSSKIPTPLGAILIIFVAFIGSLIFTLGISAAVYKFLFPGIALQEAEGLLGKISIVLGELGIGIFAVFLLKWRGYMPFRLFRFHRGPGRVVMLSFVIGLSMSIVGDELDRILQQIFPYPESVAQIAQFFRVHSWWEFGLVLSGAVFVAAIVEEALFRGMLQLSMERVASVTRAVIYTSLAWAFIHGILQWAIQIFLIGIILGYLAWRTNSIIPSVIGHALNNFLALIFYNLPYQHGIPIYEWKGFVSPLLFLPACGLLIWGIRYLDRYYSFAGELEDSTNDSEGDWENQH